MMSVVVLFFMLILPILGDGAKQPEPWCSHKCGDVEVLFPFGMKEGCYLDNGFFISCNTTYDPPKPFLRKSPINVTKISLEGQLHVLGLISRKCYKRFGVLDPDLSSEPRFTVPRLYVNDTANKFVVVGCDSYGYLRGQSGKKRYTMGCISICESTEFVNNGSCNGGGCCQASIPKDMSETRLEVGSYNNHTSVWDFNRCTYAFVIEGEQLNFTLDNLTNLQQVEKVPRVLDWTIGKETCEMAQKNLSSYACQDNSDCHDVKGYSGYRCFCKNGYEGNPYLVNGCKDIDECQDPNLNICEKYCENTLGGFKCFCPKGYHGDGKKGRKGCIRGESIVFRLVAGIALGVIILLLTACWLHLELKRRRLMKMREKFFLLNGGKLLEEKITRRGISSNMLKIFNASELQKATNNFHSSMIIGQGGYGTVYKGFLPNDKTVAIKKSKEVDPTQIDEFTNEVIVLSKINHRNVVKLLGCCLETQVPLLVYEFISNGALSEHIHNKAKARFLSWDMRLKIAAETAVVLSYLHSEAFPPIIHRDVKSANILLDHTLTTKVSDFGASRLVPLDQSQLSTVVRGTFGYLDPECLQTHQMTEKSDVYSFGVVLVELLTGMKAVSSEGPAEERNLAKFFLSVMKEDHLFQIVEANIIVREENREAIKKVAMLARSCLNMKGDDRPSMNVVAMELEGLRLGEIKHSWVQTEHNAEDTESLLSGILTSTIGESSNSTSIGFDSLEDHIISPLGNGR